MRLLWLATSMKSFDVLVALLPTDEQNLAICDLVADMLPLLHSVHKHQRQPPQVRLALSSEDVLLRTCLLTDLLTCRLTDPPLTAGACNPEQRGRAAWPPPLAQALRHPAE